MSLIELKNVSKLFSLGDFSFQALNQIHLSIFPQEFVGIMGKSGSGKTTLLNLIGGIDRPSQGEIWIRGQNTARLNDYQLSRFRAHELGFVFQTYNLMPVLTTVENVEYPLILLNKSRKERREKALQSLAKVGLEKYAHHLPAQLSGGQRQRVAIARAIVKDPLVILADEPTANLDSTTGAEVFNLLYNLRQELKTTVIYCSHDPELLKKTSRLILIQDGKLSETTTLPQF
ncbi:MAG: ABC transporter ATP-binding protein [Bdellovibrionales bacterium]|nr:ABC transporter ATP-binding protein [Bdellovibrionales bacterium]